MQNTSVFRCYTCKVQSPRYFVEDLAEQIVRGEKECQMMERSIQETREKATEIQKRVTQHQQTVSTIETTMNEIKVKCGRLGKVKTEFVSSLN